LPGRRTGSKRTKRVKRGITLIPGLLSTANIFFGYLSIAASIQGQFGKAALCIGIAFLMDGLDGRLARLTNSETALGVQLDSLADVVSFAVAPAVLCYTWALVAIRPYGFPVSFLFVICGIIRLARFNILSSQPSKKYFVGLPIPAAAVTPAAIVFYAPGASVTAFFAFLLLLLIVALSFLMVSKIRYKSFKDVDIKSRKPYSIIIIPAVIIGLIAVDPQTVLMIAAFIYAFSGPVVKLYAMFRPHKVLLPQNGDHPSSESEEVIEHDPT